MENTATNLIPAVGVMTAPVATYDQPAIVAGFGMTDARTSGLIQNPQLPESLVPPLGQNAESHQAAQSIKKVLMGVAAVGVLWYILKA